MTELILIRHGETAWNAIRRLQGHLDIPLSAAGRAQARALAVALSCEKIAAIIASDLQRAVQTAGEIARLQGVPTQLDPALRERCFGAFEGLTHTEIATRYPDEHARWQAHDPDAEFPPGTNAGESMRAFSARVVPAIAWHAARFPGQKIAVIAHGGVLDCAYRAARGLALDTPREISILNASINRFRYDGQQLQLLQWGDVAHLEAALDEL